ncbi:MAG: TonB-dependent receptor plug domain-containing protein, partial [Opitutus sp.]
MTFPHIRPVLIALIAPVFLSAQTTSSGPTSAAPEPDSDVISLSPFTVNSSTDSGYRATSTLAGSRVKTDLKDIAASVTVLTNDFMDDLGATDLAGALGLIAGAENDQTTDPTALNSLNQGYLGGDFGDTNTRDGEVRVRGLGRASTAANYIQVIASPDRYNIDRAEFLRGANSILFGLAEPAGMINYSTKVANLNRDLGKVELKVDNFGSTREVVDFSRVVLKDKLALRVAALNSDKRYPVDLAFLRDKRLFLTSTYKPFQNTTLRAFGEFTDSSGRRPNYRTAQDNVTGW